MKQSSVTPPSVTTLSGPLPISKKAYATFKARIREVYDTYGLCGEALIDILNCYLSGHRDVVDALDRVTRFAISFLLQDVDAAIERSRRARHRSMMRKLRREEEALALHLGSDPPGNDAAACPEPVPEPSPPPVEPSDDADNSRRQKTRRHRGKASRCRLVDELWEQWRSDKPRGREARASQPVGGRDAPLARSL